MAEDAATTLPAGTSDAPVELSDLALGASSRTSGRTVSEGEFMLLYDLMGATRPLYVNKQYMQGTAYGERILSGGVMIGLLVAGWASSDLFRTLVAGYRVEWTAALGIEGRFLKPLYPGDTLCIVHSIDDVRRVTDRPGEALMVSACLLVGNWDWERLDRDSEVRPPGSDQPFLLPPGMRDWLPEDDLVGGVGRGRASRPERVHGCLS